jgi:putative transposase
MLVEDPMDARTMEQILAGVSTRHYERSLEPLPEGLRQHSVDRSSVSRRFVATAKKHLAERLAESLTGWDFPIVMLDGTALGDHVLVVALGIDNTGEKHVLGLVEGTTENEIVCRHLLADLVDRGLAVERARLFVIDGGKGLRKAVRGVFGAWALVQRCQIHKLRNVIEHLPKSKQAWISASLRKAWEATTVDAARTRILGLARQLEQPHPSAAASLREGLDETLTIILLGLTGALRATLRSTNPIENLNGSLKRLTKRVKRWRGGTMALHWAAAGLLDAERRKALPALLDALQKQSPDSTIHERKIE